MVGTCEFVHKPDREFTVPCPHPAYNGAARCVFHHTLEQREELNIHDDEVRDRFIAAIESDDPQRKWFGGMTFGTLDLSELVLDAGDTRSIFLSEVTIDHFDIGQSLVRQPLSLQRCEIGTFEARDATFEYDLRCRNCELGRHNDDVPEQSDPFSHGESDFSNAQFHRQVLFVGIQFRGGFGFDRAKIDNICHFIICDFESNASFRGAKFSVIKFREIEFRGYVLFDDLICDGELDFRDVQFDSKADIRNVTCRNKATFNDIRFGSEVDLRNGTFHDVTNIEITTTSREVEFSGSNFRDEVIFDVGGASDITAYLRNAEITAGSFIQPSDDAVFYDFTDAHFGDVTLDLPTPTSFDRYRFYRTNFEGFQFVEYREALREHDWKIHDYIEPVGNTTTDLELTYLKAKRGASAVGDSDAAREFFVHEMCYRRQRYGESLSSGNVRERLGVALRWSSNTFLWITSRYGERPRRVLGWAAFVVIACSLLYPVPIIGGIETATGVYTYGTRGSLASELAAFAYDSLYFSLVTFTTLGYGNVSPASGFTRLLASFEAASGAFLAALFVFTLGRQVTR